MFRICYIQIDEEGMRFGGAKTYANEMTLREIIKDMELFSDDLIIFAHRDGTWLIDSTAALLHVSDSQDIGVVNEGLSYFLKVETTKKVLDVWKNWRSGRKPSEDQKIEAIIFYADNDAYTT